MMQENMGTLPVSISSWLNRQTPDSRISNTLATFESSRFLRWIMAPLFWLALLTPSMFSHATEFRATPPDYVGMHIHRSDQGTKWPAIAFGSWRLWDAYVSWPQLESRQGQWDFSRLDRYVAMAKIKNVEILLPLGLSPQWASARPYEKSGYSPGFAAEPKNIEDWRHYVHTVASRYKGRIHQYEIWNEVNIQGFYSGSVETLARLTCEAHKVLKEVDPENILVSPSVVGVGKHLEWHAKLMEQGIGTCVDAIGHHFYVPKSTPEAMVQDIGKVREILRLHGAGHLPLWNTEAGWWIENTDGSPETGIDTTWKRIPAKDLASVVARALIIGRAEGLERYFLYAWDNKSMGFVEPSTQSLKPGAMAIEDVYRWLQEWRLGTCEPQKGIWLCALKNDSGQEAWIVWADKETHIWSPPRRSVTWQAFEAGQGTQKSRTGFTTLSIGDVPTLIRPLQQP